MEQSTRKFEEKFEGMLNDPNENTFTKLELSKVFLEIVDDLIEEWVLARQIVKKGIEKLMIELENEKSV